MREHGDSGLRRFGGVIRGGLRGRSGGVLCEHGSIAERRNAQKQKKHRGNRSPIAHVNRLLQRTRAVVPNPRWESKRSVRAKASEKAFKNEKGGERNPPPRFICLTLSRTAASAQAESDEKSQSRPLENACSRSSRTLTWETRDLDCRSSDG